jgi:hypothetical protein
VLALVETIVWPLLPVSRKTPLSGDASERWMASTSFFMPVQVVGGQLSDIDAA